LSFGLSICNSLRRYIILDARSGSYLISSQHYFCDDKTSLIGPDIYDDICLCKDVWPCEALFDGEKGVNKKIEKII
jgi:hypothetical protein